MVSPPRVTRARIREKAGRRADVVTGPTGDDAVSLATIKPIGDEIRRREVEGTLPSTMVARSDRRSKSKLDPPR